MARHYGGNAMPRTPSELADLLMDPVQAAQVMNSTPEKMGEFRREYTSRIMNSGDVDQQIAQQTQSVLGEYLKANNTSGSPVNIGRAARHGGAYNAAAPGAKVDAVFRDKAEVFRSVSWRNQHDRGAQERLSKVSDIMNSFGSGSRRTAGS